MASNSTSSSSPGVGEPGGFILYHYTPSLGASALFAALFLLSTVLHGFQIFRTKSWFFIPMFIGCAMEGIGYIGRVLSHHDTKALVPYMMQSVLLLVAPALFAVSIYVILGRLIVKLEAQRHSLVRVNWLTKIFVTVDVFSSLVLSSGAGITVKGNGSSMDLGKNIILAGLFVQIIGFGIFIIVAVIFHLRMNKFPTAAASQYKFESRHGLIRRLVLGPEEVSWTEMLLVLYLACSLIMIRSIFRVVEYAQGFDGFLWRNEVWLLVFDALLMFIAAAIFHPYHPSKFLGSSVRRGRQWDEERSQSIPLDSAQRTRG
ncbi:RTA1-domain-containing protein [Marasmius fiardii PR-910]|nr:RTA1-domain-containing protein [Marasmius fiardii PR-910]